MAATIRSRFSFRAAILLLLVLAGTHAYQIPKRVAFYTPTQRTLANSCPKLNIGADFDSDLEAALGQAPLSEYERDAEFYRKRNEDYYNSLNTKSEEEVGAFSFSDAGAEHVEEPKAENPGWMKDSVKASETSFRFVEDSTSSMLTERPMMALAIFAAAGLVVAYLSGFFFLEGYIEDWNPAENDMIPYWDDAEIHTIERALPGE